MTRKRTSTTLVVRRLFYSDRQVTWVSEADRDSPRANRAKGVALMQAWEATTET
jgi:hypothetical protein